VHQVDVERGAQHAQIVAAEAGVIVQQEGTDDAAARDRVIEHGEEAMLGLAESGFEIRDDAAAVVEQPEDDDALRASGGGIEEDGAVKRVSLPELSAHGSFPTVAGRAVKLHARAGQAAAAQQALQGRDSDLAAADAAGQLELAHDKRARAAWVFALQINDELLQLRGQDAAAAGVRARDRLEGLEAAMPVVVEPFFESLVGKLPRPAAVVFEGPGGQICQQATQLSPSQIPAEQLAEDSVSEEGFLDAVIIVHRLPPGWFR